MKNSTMLPAALLLASIGMSAHAQECTYKTPHGGWTSSEWYKVIHIDAATLKDASLPKTTAQDGKFNAQEADYATGQFETAVLDGLNNIETGSKFPIHYYMCTFAPEHFGSAYTKVEDYGEEPSGKNHPCSKNDNTVLPSSVFGKQGFIELSRLPGDAEAQISKHGYLQIDNLYQVDRIQWSFSSTSWGRGVKMEVKWPGEEEWTEQRWVPSRSDKKDGYYVYATFAERGYEYEEIIGMEGEPDQPISVRWRIWDGDETTWGSLPTDDPEYKVYPVNPYAQQQIARLHEIKIYSGLPGADFVQTSIKTTGYDKPFFVSQQAQQLIFSEEADIALYSTEGTIVAKQAGVTKMNIDHLNKGIYIVKATTNDGIVRNRKVVLN